MSDGDDSGVDVSVLVTNWNGGDILRECLRSLLRETHGTRYETIVIDDCSTDGSAEMVGREFPGLRLLRNSVNAGFVRANNAGAEIARGRYLFLLNSDTLLLNNAVSILSEYMDRNLRVGVCGGMLLFRNGSPQISFGYEPSLRQSLADALFLNDLFPRFGLPSRGMVPDPEAQSPLDVEYVSGADLMVRRDFVERSGLFDTAFEAYCEEVDLCRRVRRNARMQVHFVPGARIVHLGGVSYGKLGRRRIRVQCRSDRTFLRKYHGAVYTGIVRLLFAWRYSMKFAARLARWATAHGEQKASLRESALDALYFVLYNIVSGSEYALLNMTFSPARRARKMT